MEEEIPHYSSTPFPAGIPWTHPSPATDYNLFSGDKTLRLFHLLIAAAEALSGEQRELAGVILIRLKTLLLPPESAATIAGRLAAHFTDALQSLLAGKGPAFIPPPSSGDLSALLLMQDMSPLTKFAHFTANQAILDAAAGGGFRRLHIIDFDLKEGIQWASLMQALVSDKNAAFTPPSLKITAVAGDKQTGERLSAFAASMGLPFSFGHRRLDRNQRFRPPKTVKGEALMLNCVLLSPETPHRTAAAVKSFIGGATAAGACLVTVVEEEKGFGNEAEGFKGRFMDEMERYWAIMEGMEEEFPEQRRGREMVEKWILAPRIKAAVRKAYCEEEEEEEEKGGVGGWMKAVGFRRVKLSGFNVLQAKMLIELFGCGYKVEEEEEGSNKLVLRWKSRRLVSAACWSAPAAARGN